MTHDGTRHLRLGACLLTLGLAVGCGSSSTPGGGDAGGDDGAVRDATPGDDGGTGECAEGKQRFWPGCAESDLVSLDGPGCYRTCEGTSDASCGEGTACRTAWIDPCVCPDSDGCCEACAAEQQLCLPEDQRYRMASLDELCDETLSGQDVLDSIASEYAATLTYTDDSSTTGATITVSYGGGPILCQPAMKAPPGSGAPDRPASVLLQVTLSFKTEDGAFDETLIATVESFTAGSATLDGSLPAAFLSGTYEPTLTDVDSVDIAFGGQLTPDSSSGNVMQQGTADGVGRTAPVGMWDTGG